MIELRTLTLTPLTMISFADLVDQHNLADEHPAVVDELPPLMKRRWR